MNWEERYQEERYTKEANLGHALQTAYNIIWPEGPKTMASDAVDFARFMTKDPKQRKETIDNAKLIPSYIMYRTKQVVQNVMGHPAPTPQTSQSGARIIPGASSRLPKTTGFRSMLQKMMPHHTQTTPNPAPVQNAVQNNVQNGVQNSVQNSVQNGLRSDPSGVNGNSLGGVGQDDQGDSDV